MRLQNPLAALNTTGLDSQVLLVLGRTEQYLSTAEVRRLIPEGGSLEGVRRSLRRLAEQGTVSERMTGKNSSFAINREHLLIEPILQIIGAKETLIQRLAAHVAQWNPPPLTVKLFGSAARGNMSDASDLDLLVVFPDRVSKEDAVELVDQLASLAHRWTGNDVRPLLYSESEVVPASIFDSILIEGIDIAGEPSWLRRRLRETRI